MFVAKLLLLVMLSEETQQCSTRVACRPLPKRMEKYFAKVRKRLEKCKSDNIRDFGFTLLASRPKGKSALTLRSILYLL